MAHKTLIGGTAYEVSGGKTLVGGTAYSIAGGKTLVGGTAYDISFGEETFTFKIEYTTFTATVGMTWYEWANSKYNTQPNMFTCAGTNSYIMVNGAVWILHPTTFAWQMGSDVIEANCAYITN